MSKALGMRMWGLCGVLTGVFGLALAAQAEVTSDNTGSIVVYPKVMYSEMGRDTVIQLSNTSNNVVYAHCFYVDARESFGRPLWQVTDFRLVLTKQQPTHWVVSQGRRVDNTDNYQDPIEDGAGLDPGAIPPVQDGFQGELKCVQTDASGTPFGGNNLKGEAVLRTVEGDVAKHNALAIVANPDLASDGDPEELLLNNTEFNDGEYNSCANQILIDHYTDGSSSGCAVDVCEEGTCSESGGSCDDTSDCEPISCPIRPYLTVVPCQQDFENLIPEQVTFQFEIFNEFEDRFSTSTTADCWLNTRMADIDVGNGVCTDSGDSCGSDDDCGGGIDLCDKSGSVFSYGLLGTDTAFTLLKPVDLDGGVIAVGEELHYSEDGAGSAWSAWNLHQEGTRYEATLNEPDGPRIDRIRIPSPF